MPVPSDFGVRESDLNEITVANDLRSAKSPEDRILEELAGKNYSPEARFAIRLALEEALTNAVKHGNRNNASKRLHIRYHVDTQRTVIGVCDEGAGFAPAKIPDPTIEENLERPCGRGIMLMCAYMTKVRYNKSGNEVWLLRVNQPEHGACDGRD